MESLRTLLQSVTCITDSQNCANPAVTGIEYDSRQIQPGYLFCAIRGDRWDGHDFVHEAVQRGCSAVVAEKPVSAAVPVVYVTDSRLALAQLSNDFYQYPAEKLTMIGITASNGKTTTSFMTDRVLAAHFQRTGLIGTVVVKDGPIVREAELTTPHSRDLLRLLSQMHKNNCSHVTMEVSSAGIELHRIHGISYKIATFNNVSREHIDFHGSFENYWRHKSSLITNLSAEATAVLNADDQLVSSLKEKTAARVISYSLKGNPATVQIRDLDISTGQGRFTLHVSQPLKPQVIPIELKVLGLHNVYNATVAAIVGLLCQVSAADIRCALATFGGVERRFELIYDGEFKVLDDHFANAGNIDITLETLQMMQYRKLVLLVAIRGNRGCTVNRENADTIVKWADKLDLSKLIVTDSLGYVGDNDAVSPQEQAIFLSTLRDAGIVCTHIARLEQAIAAALATVRAKDVLLLAGCQGMDYGASIILPKIAENLPESQRTQILELLKHRVAGTS